MDKPSTFYLGDRLTDERVQSEQAAMNNAETATKRRGIYFKNGLPSNNEFPGGRFLYIFLYVSLWIFI